MLDQVDVAEKSAAFKLADVIHDDADVAAFFASYFQMTITGGIGQRIVWKLRNNIFKKLQELPYFDNLN